MYRLELSPGTIEYEDSGGEGLVIVLHGLLMVGTETEIGGSRMPVSADRHCWKEASRANPVVSSRCDAATTGVRGS